MENNEDNKIHLTDEQIKAFASSIDKFMNMIKKCEWTGGNVPLPYKSEINSDCCEDCGRDQCFGGSVCQEIKKQKEEDE